MKHLFLELLLCLLLPGCVTVRSDSFCLWANPITITKQELSSLSDYTLREIDNYNQNYETLCGKK